MLAGLAVPEAVLPALQAGVYAVRRPYHEDGIGVLKADDELDGSELLREITFRSLRTRGFSYQWNLAGESIDYCRKSGFRVFGVVCFDDVLRTFACENQHRLDRTFQYLFERIDRYVKREHPGRRVKLVFDDRHHSTNEKNARAITNFLVKSPVGQEYDSILPYPLFSVSQAHNYGLQLADLITTVIAMKFQGREEIQPLWDQVRSMLYRFDDGSHRWTSLKLLRGTQ